MKHAFLRGGGGKKPFTSLLFALAATGFLIGATPAFAAPPAAKTEIGNQAKATYIDSNSVSQSTLSNKVTTTVLQVGSLTLEENRTVTAAAGQVVYAQHTLTNTGNGPDTFTLTATTTATDMTPLIYADSDGNGSPDSMTPLAAGTLVTVNGGAAYKFVVGYPVPTGATATWSATATVTAQATLTGLYTAAAAANTDTVKATNLAAFTFTKTITQPNGITAASGHTWNAVLTSGKVGSKTVFTLNYSNTGARGGALYIADVLPAGFTYETASAVWSSKPGFSLNETGAAAITEGTDSIWYKYDTTTRKIEVLVPNVGSGQSGSVSFNVTVAAGATVGTSTTTNIASANTAECSSVPADLNDAPGKCALAANSVTKSSAVFTVTASYDLAYGDKDPTLGTPATTDTVTVAKAVPGKTISFTKTITNNGNAADTFNLKENTAAYTAYNFPTGTAFAWTTAANAPLQDTNSDGVVDTGVMAAGESKTVVLLVTLPSTTPLSSTGFTARPEATSVGAKVAGETVYDLIEITVGSVVGDVADLYNFGTTNLSGDLGPGPGTAATLTKTTQVGSTLEFKLTLKNTDTGSLDFALSSGTTDTASGSLPTGWVVQFQSNSCSSASATVIGSVTAPVTVGPNATQDLYACVTLASNAATTPANSPQSLFFKATSVQASASTGVKVSDVLWEAVNVTAQTTALFTVTPDISTTIAPGLSVLLSHAITNTGTQACFADKKIKFDVQGLPTGWTYSIYIDANGNGAIDQGEDPLTSTGTNGSFDFSALTAFSNGVVNGKPMKFLIKVFSPGAVSLGTVVTATVVVADLSSANACAKDGKTTDTFTVGTSSGGGTMSVVKTQATNTLCDAVVADTAFTQNEISVKPGECVVYKIVATNTGSSPLTNVSIADQVPSITTYSANQPANPCTATALGSGSVGLATSGTASGSTVTCGGTNTLNSGASITLKFGVMVVTNIN